MAKRDRQRNGRTSPGNKAAQPRQNVRIDHSWLLTNLQDGDILFIDEVTACTGSSKKCCTSAMEDFKLDIMLGEVRVRVRSDWICLNLLPLIGATTRTGTGGTLRDRMVWFAEQNSQP